MLMVRKYFVPSFFLCEHFIFTVLHHIHCIGSGLLAVGYKDQNNCEEPSLGFIRLSSLKKSTRSTLVDLSEKVCNSDFCESYSLHKYFTTYIESWSGAF